MQPSRTAADPTLVDLTIIHAREPFGDLARIHRHPVHELMYIVRGRYRVRIGGVDRDGGPGAIFIYPPHLEHAPLLGAGASSEAILLQWREADEQAARSYPLSSEDRDGRIRSALGWLIDLRDAPQPADRSAAQALLAALLHELARSGERRRPLIQSVRTYLDDHLAERIRIADLAASVGVSRFHLMRRFRAEAGMPLMRFCLRLRLARACLLLAQPDVPLAAIARQVGLCSAFHLSARFKSEYGVPPSVWRRRHLEAGAQPSPAGAASARLG